MVCFLLLLALLPLARAAQQSFHVEHEGRLWQWTELVHIRHPPLEAPEG